MVKPVDILRAVREYREPPVRDLNTPSNLIPGRHPHEVDGHEGLGQRKDKKPTAKVGKPANRAYDVGGVKPTVEADSSGAHMRYGRGRWTDHMRAAPNAYDAQPFGDTQPNQLIEEPGNFDEAAYDVGGDDPEDTVETARNMARVHARQGRPAGFRIDRTHDYDTFKKHYMDEYSRSAPKHIEEDPSDHEESESRWEPVFPKTKDEYTDIRQNPSQLKTVADAVTNYDRRKKSPVAHVGFNENARAGGVSAGGIASAVGGGIAKKKVGALFGGTMVKRQPDELDENFMHDPEWGVYGDLGRLEGKLSQMGWARRGNSRLFANREYPRVWIQVLNGEQIAVEGPGSEPVFRGSLEEFSAWLQQTGGRMESRKTNMKKPVIRENLSEVVSKALMQFFGPKWGRELNQRLKTEKPELFNQIAQLYGEVLRGTMGMSAVRDQAAWAKIKDNPKAHALARELQQWALPIIQGNPQADAWMQKKAGKLRGAVPMGYAQQEEEPEMEEGMYESVSYEKKGDVARSVRVRRSQPDGDNPKSEVGKPGLNKEFNQARSVPVKRLKENLRELQTLLGRSLRLSLFENNPMEIPAFLKRYKDTDPMPWDKGGDWETNPTPNRVKLKELPPMRQKPGAYRGNPADADVEAPTGGERQPG